MDRTCCFFGHRKIMDTEELRAKITDTVERLIVDENIDTFLFGSRSQFDSLCHELVTELKEKYPHIKRVFVRAEYPYIDESYRAYILEDYEDTYFPEHMINAGKASYVERNCEMIDKSSICIVYYHHGYDPPRRKASRSSLTDYQPRSGTRIAYDYATRKNKRIINIQEEKF